MSASVHTLPGTYGHADPNTPPTHPPTRETQGPGKTGPSGLVSLGTMLIWKPVGIGDMEPRVHRALI